jgi:uncharacterized membrane protein
MSQALTVVAADAPTSRPVTNVVLWALLALFTLGRVLQLFAGSAPGYVPLLAVIVLHVVPALLFALIHGAQLCGTRAIVIFFALFLVLGNIIENIGVLTGFPFGHYYFTERMGPKFFQVPITLGLAYLGMSYLAWVLAGLILNGGTGPDGSTTIGTSSVRVFALPLTASFLMTAWDFSMDPVWSHDPALLDLDARWRVFRVPVTNFLGWLLTNYFIYQLFAFYLRKRSTGPTILAPSSSRLAVLFYSVSAAGNLLLLLGKPPGGLAIVTDGAGNAWRVRDIVGATALVSIFCMGAFAIFAWVRLTEESV